MHGRVGGAAHVVHLVTHVPAPGEHSAVLCLGTFEPDVYPGGDCLLVSAAEGHYSVSVSVSVGDASRYLVGDAAAQGAVPLTVGGQCVPHPRRYLVSLERTIEVALSYFRTGAVDAGLPDWDDGRAWAGAG